jgi:apolipoprotein N-acyltransferase
MGRHERLAALLLGTLSGSLYWASIPTLDIGPLAFACLVPCMLAAAWLPPRQAMAAAFCGGAVSGLGRAYWIAPTLQIYGYVPAILALATTVLLIAYMATYWVAFARIARTLAPSSSTFPLLAASAWVVLEWASSWVISGFPWELLGYTQHRNLALLQTASLVGVYGLSFLIVYVNATLVQLVLARLPRRRALAMAMVPVALIAALQLWGQHRLRHLDAQAQAPIRIGLVQGSVPQGSKWLRNQREATVSHYRDLTRSLPPDSLDLIILPETALPFYLDHAANAAHRQRVVELAQEMNTPLLVGSLGGSWEHGVYNRAFLFDRGGKATDFADKVHLVPFGEYLPMAWLFRYLEGLTAQSGAFLPGAEHKVLPLPGTDARLGVFICFESVFPAITRQLTRLGSTVLVTTTNDAWFGRTAAPWQHFSMVVLRAVETGRPVVRVANTGISGLITASGRVRHTTGLFETTSRVLEVTPSSEQTPYVRYGDWVVWASWALLLGALVTRAWRSGQQVQRERQAARADLERFACSPRPLTRPLVLLHGYQNSPESWRHLLEHLERCSTGTEGMIHAPELNADLGLGELAGQIQCGLPAGDLDLIGHSMGGLLALELDALRGQSTGRILTLASPLRGTWMARCGYWLRFPCRDQLRDMIPSSPVVTRARGLLAAQHGRLHAWYVPGDTVVPRQSALVPEAAHRLYSYPWLGNPLDRHRFICTDVRVIRDLIALLQDRDSEPGLSRQIRRPNGGLPRPR